MILPSKSLRSDVMAATGALMTHQVSKNIWYQIILQEISKSLNFSKSHPNSDHNQKQYFWVNFHYVFCMILTRIINNIENAINNGVIIAPFFRFRWKPPCKTDVKSGISSLLENALNAKSRIWWELSWDIMQPSWPIPVKPLCKRVAKNEEKSILEHPSKSWYFQNRAFEMTHQRF